MLGYGWLISPRLFQNVPPYFAADSPGKQLADTPHPSSIAEFKSGHQRYIRLKASA